MEMNLFEEDNSVNNWQEHWIGMPEYKNVIQDKPAIIATFKFKSQKDFEEFNALIKKHLYNGEKVFDGMQRKESKSAWYPLPLKASKFIYSDES
jgi:hypothetical protein